MDFELRYHTTNIPNPDVLDNPRVIPLVFTQKRLQFRHLNGAWTDVPETVEGENEIEARDRLRKERKP